MDITAQLEAIQRKVGLQPIEGGEGVGVLMRRRYEATAEDLWEALTDPDRMRRWFLPLSGDLQVGGKFQLEGNAGGDILACEPPRMLRVTFGGPSSVVEVRLTPAGEEATELELEHTVPIEMAGSGAGAFFVGPGWDGAFLALALHVAGEASDDPVAAANSPEAREFTRRSVDAWEATVTSSGTATPEEIAAGREMALAQFAPDTGE
jgi:uncharacterized protein YndB with AHSA1/START domain